MLRPGRAFGLHGPAVPGRLRRLTPAGRRRMALLLLDRLTNGPAMPADMEHAAHDALAFYSRPPLLLLPSRRSARPRPGRPLSAGRVASPGGWVPPPGSKPGWDWLPPRGLGPRPDLAPRWRWVRVWYRTPLVDRYAHVWLWAHGRMETDPPAAGVTVRPGAAEVG